jgi:hypothetical protein
MTESGSMRVIGKETAAAWTTITAGIMTTTGIVDGNATGAGVMLTDGKSTNTTATITTTVITTGTAKPEGTIRGPLLAPLL